MNRLLQRQIKRTLGKDFELDTLPEDIQNLLRYVDNSYNEFDKERALLDNMLEISSSELTQVNRLLKKENIKKITLLEKKFKTMFDKSTDGIAIIKNNRFTEYNVSMTKMFGYGLDEFHKIHLSRLLPVTQPDGSSSIRKMLHMLIEAKDKTVTFEWLHTKSSGDAFWVEITLSPMEINQEKVIHGIWREISDRKKVEHKIKELNATLESKVKQEVEKNREKDKQLLEQSRLAQMGEMISMIAHQWRQPLSAISATTNGLILKNQRGNYDSEIFDQRLHKIAIYSQHLSATIDDFRNFFKKNKEKEETTFEKVIEEVLNITQISLENKNINVSTDFQYNKKVRIYANELKQVILNLLKNAEDVLLEKKISDSKIIIRTFTKNGYTGLSVEDNGGGIDESIIGKIFDPYFSTKQEKDGTGLGLYMSKTIVEEHCSGRLNVSNNKDGAVFTISIENIYKQGKKNEKL